MQAPTNALQALGLMTNNPTAQRATLGAMEVLGTPAQEVTGTDSGTKVVKYRNVEYTHSDDCHLGCSNGVAGGVTIPAGTQLKIQGTPTSPFKPMNCVVPSYQQINLFMQQTTIGPFNAVEGDPVPVAAHSEVSLSQFVDWPVIEANSPITFYMLNADAADKTHLAIDVRGLRFRP